MRQLQPTVILSGTRAKKHPRGGEVAYLQYVRHLEKTSTFVKAATTAGTVEHFAQGYQDYLQAPLQVSPIHLLHPGALAQWALFIQPLMDNLQSITYQTFEQDPGKYRNYEEVRYCRVAPLRVLNFSCAHRLSIWP